MMNEKKPFLFVSGAYHVYGKERVVLTLINGLSKRGFNVSCLTNGWSNGDYAKELDVIGVSHTSANFGWFFLKRPSWTYHTIINLPNSYSTLRRVLKTCKPSAVFHDSYRTLALFGWFPQCRNIAIVQDYAEGFRAKAWTKLTDRLVEHYVVCSNDVKANLLSVGIKPSKITKVNNPARFGEGIRTVAVPRSFDGATIGIVGQVSPRKGHGTVIDALVEVQAKGEQNFRLLVFGDGDANYISELKAQAQRVGVLDKIEWRGYVKSKDEIYPHIDFSLVPSITPDPAPLATIEPAVYGKPAIGSDIGGIPEMIVDGQTGFVVKPGDVHMLADRILRMIQNPGLAKELGQNAFNDYRNRFSEKQFVDGFERVLGVSGNSDE